MAYNVKIEAFEGPFDLLLYLVSRKRVDIGAISINEIADQYLEEVSRMRNLDLDVASDFLLVASTLLEIKAHSLIPRERDELDDEVAELAPDDAREMLIQRLVTYKQYKSAAEALHQRFVDESRLHGRAFGSDADFIGLMPDFLEGVTVDALGMLAANAMARREIFLLESEHIAAKPIPVEVHVQAIHARIRTKKRLSFKELIAGDTRPALVVVTFLAILELYKRRMVYLEQPNPFGDIEIGYIEESQSGSVDPDASSSDSSSSADPNVLPSDLSSLRSE